MYTFGNDSNLTGAVNRATVHGYPGTCAMLGRPSDEEALRLTIAFCCIMEPDKRATVLALAEKLAQESAAVEGVVHFLLLERDETANH